MKRFEYRAKNGPIDVVRGVIEAETKEKAVDKIIRLGHVPIDVQPVDPSVAGFKALYFGKEHHQKIRVSKRLVCFFTRQMSDMLEAGVPLLKALQLMARQIHRDEFKRIVEHLYTAVKEGDSFSAALSRYPAVFSPFYINLVRSGEMSGRLPDVIQRLAGFLEQDMKVRSQVMMSLIYPGFIFVTGLASVFVLLSFVLPRITVIFDDFNTELPLITRLVVGVSYFCAHYWWAILLVLAGGIYYAYRVLSTHRGKAWFDQQIFRLPLLGSFWQQVEIGRLARTMATLLEGGVSIAPALDAVRLVTDNFVMADRMERVTQEVKNGVALSSAFEANGLGDDLTVSMISVGEQSGDLAKAFYKLADTYERQTAETMQVGVNVLGWLVLVVVVCLVGGMIIAVLLPIFQMNLIIN